MVVNRLDMLDCLIKTQGELKSLYKQTDREIWCELFIVYVIIFEKVV
jgi:hypothetical protein